MSIQSQKLLSIQAIYESSKQQQKNIAISMISKTQAVTENSSCQTFTAIGSFQLTTTMDPGISAVSVAVISHMAGLDFTTIFYRQVSTFVKWITWWLRESYGHKENPAYPMVF